MVQLNASSIQKMLRRQCGVPAFSSRPALATRGTMHCTRFPNVERDWLPFGSDSDTAAYVAMTSSHSPTKIPMEREEGMLVRLSSLGGKRSTERAGASFDGVRINRVLRNLPNWRRRRDLNPRDPFGPNGFQDRRFQPLTHSSVSDYNWQLRSVG